MMNANNFALIFLARVLPAVWVQAIHKRNYVLKRMEIPWKTIYREPAIRGAFDDFAFKNSIRLLTETPTTLNYFQ